MELPINTVFVIGFLMLVECFFGKDNKFALTSSEYLTDNELSSSSHCAGIVPKVSMLEEDTVVFFMDANRILDCFRGTSTIDKMAVHIVDASFTITAQRQTVRHVPHPIFTQVEAD